MRLSTKYISLLICTENIFTAIIELNLYYDDILLIYLLT